jgi:transcriptional regulator with XRE-family HTH domain
VPRCPRCGSPRAMVLLGEHLRDRASPSGTAWQEPERVRLVIESHSPHTSHIPGSNGAQSAPSQFNGSGPSGSDHVCRVCGYDGLPIVYAVPSEAVVEVEADSRPPRQGRLLAPESAPTLPESLYEEVDALPPSMAGLLRLFRPRGNGVVDGGTGPSDAVPDPDASGSHEASPVESSLGLGEALRRTRERQGLRLSEVAGATRIREDFLVALEHDAPVDAFPSMAYARLFLRGYSRHLGVDEGRMLESFEALHPRAYDNPIRFLAPAVPPPSRVFPRVIMVMAGLVLAALIVRGMSIGTGDQRTSAGRFPKPAESASATPSPRTRAGSTIPRPGAGAAAKPATRLLAVLKISAPCWIRAVSDGRMIYQNTATSGTTLRFRAKHHLDLILGNSGGARLLVNDRHIQTGQSGQVSHYSITLNGGAARVSRTA